MPQAVITVTGITPPAPGKKQGRIIDTENQSWNVWGDKLHNYRIGVSYNIGYDTQEFNGHQFNVIKSAEPTNRVPPVTAAPQASPQTYSVAPGFTVKDEMIFVCGAFNNLMSLPDAWNLTKEQMADKVEDLMWTFQVTLGGKGRPVEETAKQASGPAGSPTQKPQYRTAQEMDDEIPF